MQPSSRVFLRIFILQKQLTQENVFSVLQMLKISGAKSTEIFMNS